MVIKEVLESSCHWGLRLDWLPLISGFTHWSQTRRSSLQHLGYTIPLQCSPLNGPTNHHQALCQWFPHSLQFRTSRVVRRNPSKYSRVRMSTRPLPLQRSTSQLLLTVLARTSRTPRVASSFVAAAQSALNSSLLDLKVKAEKRVNSVLH